MNIRFTTLFARLSRTNSKRAGKQEGGSERADPQAIARSIGGAYSALEQAFASRDVNAAYEAARDLEKAAGAFSLEHLRRASERLRDALDAGDTTAALMLIAPVRETITSLAATLMRMERDVIKAQKDS